MYSVVMNLKKSFLIIFIFFAIIFSTFSETTKKYFKNIKYNEKGEIFGIGFIEEISPDIQVSALYEFVYDEDKLISVSGIRYKPNEIHFTDIKYKEGVKKYM